MDTISILIVDDAPLFRDGIRAAVAEASAEFLVVGEATDGAHALDLALTHEPAVVLLNATLAGPSGLAVIRTLKRQVPSAAVIVVVDHEDEDTLFAAITDGAAAYLPKSVDAGDLRDVIRRVARGDYLINDRVLSTPVVAARVLASFRDLTHDVEPEAWSLYMPLSPREIEVLGVVAQGNSNKEIATILGISDQTVKNHITAIMRKLAVNDRTHAVVYALRHGWITDAPGARRGAAAPET
jgi:DNA-binding NarL/FixJ family response regulator